MKGASKEWAICFVYLESLMKAGGFAFEGRNISYPSEFCWKGVQDTIRSQNSAKSPKFIKWFYVSDESRTKCPISFTKNSIKKLTGKLFRTHPKWKQERNKEKNNERRREEHSGFLVSFLNLKEASHTHYLFSFFRA